MYNGSVAGSGIGVGPDVPKPSIPRVKPFQYSPPVVVHEIELKLPMNSMTPDPSVPDRVFPLTDKQVLQPPQYPAPWLRIVGAALKLYDTFLLGLPKLTMSRMGLSNGFENIKVLVKGFSSLREIRSLLVGTFATCEFV